MRSTFKLEKNTSLGIDKSTDKKLRSGKLRIDIKIDLHGLTLSEAFDSLVFNIDKAFHNNMKCMLVITGKGKNTPENRDSIKSQLGRWFQTSEVSSKIIKYVDATPKHGGTGAVYILIRTKPQNKRCDKDY